MVCGFDSNAVTVFGFVVKSRIGFEFIIGNGEDIIIRVSRTAYQGIGESVSCIWVYGGEITNFCINGLIFGNCAVI